MTDETITFTGPSTITYELGLLGAKLELPFNTKNIGPLLEMERLAEIERRILTLEKYVGIKYD